MFVQFIVSFAGTYLALTLFRFLKGEKPEPKTSFKFPSPADVTRTDLGNYLEAVNKALDKDFKAEDFPIRIPFPQLISYTKHGEAKEIICGILQMQGWVVIPTKNPDSIKLDLPRVKSLCPEPT